jgi:hypothetical protein
MNILLKKQETIAKKRNYKSLKITEFFLVHVHFVVFKNCSLSKLR